MPVGTPLVVAFIPSSNREFKNVRFEVLLSRRGEVDPTIEFDGGIPNARRPSSSRFETQKFNYFRIIQAVV